MISSNRSSPLSCSQGSLYVWLEVITSNILKMYFVCIEYIVCICRILYLHLIETFSCWDCVRLLFCYQNLQLQIFLFDVIFSMMRHVLVYFLYPEHFGKLQLLDEPAIIIFSVKLNYHFIGLFIQCSKSKQSTFKIKFSQF